MPRSWLFTYMCYTNCLPNSNYRVHNDVYEGQLFQHKYVWFYDILKSLSVDRDIPVYFSVYLYFKRVFSFTNFLHNVITKNRENMALTKISRSTVQ